jgi:acyl carrier protein
MDRLQAVRELMANILGVSSERIAANTVQADIPEWDSVSHLNLMLSLEDAFGIRLGIEHIARLRSVGEILKHLETACPST